MTPVAADVAVIGAGPGGLAAATAAARAGARVHLLDAAPAPGGQYWMQASGASGRASRQMIEGARAIEAARRAGVTFHLGAETWAIFPTRRICAATSGGPLEVTAKSIVIATGAHDRVAPFPGWTLPGVVTAGAAQRLAKLDGIAVGKRVVVAGSGPFLLAVAAAVQATGAVLAGYVEARRPSVPLAAHFARYPERWIETLRLLRALGGRRTRRHFGWVVTAALGHERVEAVRIAPLAGRGGIDATRARTVEDVDALVVGWGFRPSIELSALLRCRHAFDEARGGWCCVADPLTGRTSVDGVFAAGEVTGVAGALPARLAGALAGRAAATELGFRGSEPARGSRASARRLLRARSFADDLNRLFVPPPQLAAVAADDTIVCRCEEVTLGEIRTAVADGAGTVSGVKRLTRAGMGPCQGRICSWSVARVVAPGESSERAGFNQPRIPVRPVPLTLIAQTLAGDAD